MARQHRGAESSDRLRGPQDQQGFQGFGTVKQDRDLFRMPLEVEVLTTGKAERAGIDLMGKSTSFDIETFSMPKQVVIDPGYKILRDSKELQLSVQISLGDDLRARDSWSRRFVPTKAD